MACEPWVQLLSLPVHHRAWDDPVFAEGLRVCAPLAKAPCTDLDDEEVLHQSHGAIKCSAPGCNKQFLTVAEHAGHQRASHAAACQVCRHAFPSHHLLDLHLLETHDSLFALMAEKKPMYQCLLETCPEKFSTAEERKKHCIAKHKFPHDFRYDLTFRKLETKGKKAKHSPSAMECDDTADTTAMSTINGSASRAPQARRGKARVPTSVCFGAGVPRGFARGRGRGAQHWHQRGRPPGPTKTNIEEVNMKELEDCFAEDEAKMA